MSQHQATTNAKKQYSSHQTFANSSKPSSRQTSLLQETAADSSCTAACSERLTMGNLLYRLSALLTLQTLYAALIKENKELKDRLQMHELRSSRLEEESRTSKTISSNESEGNPRVSLIADNRGDGDFLFPSLYRSLQMELSEKSKLIARVEGMTSSELVKRYCELKEENQRLETLVKKMKRELEVHREPRSSSAHTSGVDGRMKRSVVEKDKRLQLSAETTLVRELGSQLKQKTREVDKLHCKLDVEKYGRKKAQLQLSRLLNDFVQCCQQIDHVTNDPDLKKALEELKIQSENLPEFGLQLAAAIDVVHDVSSSFDFLQIKDSDPIDIAEISLAQAKNKITELQANEKRLRREAGNQIIDQMRKRKQGSTKIKDLEERLEKSEADKRLIEERLRDENHRLRCELDEQQQTLGHRSSYAVSAAQSVRALVELVEEQKMELEATGDRLRADVVCYQQTIEELQRDKKELECSVNRLNATALEEATAKVKNDLDSLRLECSRLQDENRSLEERVELLQETTKQDRVKHRSLSETLEQLECQIKVYQSEMEAIQKVNASLVEAKKKAETELEALKKRAHTLLTERRDPLSMQSLESTRVGPQRSGGVVSPQLGFHSLAQPQFPSVFEQDRSAPGVSTPDDVMTQSLPPTLHVFPSHQSSFRANHPDRETLQSVESQRQSSLRSFRDHRVATGVPTDSGFGQSMGDSRRGVMTTRSLSPMYKYDRELPARNVMKCLRCGSSFSVDNLDGYEKHIKECYFNVQ